MTDRDRAPGATPPEETGRTPQPTNPARPAHDERPPGDAAQPEAPAPYRRLPIRAVRAALASRSDQEVAAEWAIPVELVERLRREYRLPAGG